MGAIHTSEERKERVIGIIRETPYISTDEQKRAIEDFVKRKINNAEIDFAVIPARLYTNWHPFLLKEKIHEFKAKIAVVYSWNLLGRSCKYLLEILSSIFNSEIKEIYQVINGDKITKNEWKIYREFLVKIVTSKPVSKQKIDLRIVKKVQEYVPLTIEEARVLYNILAEKEKLPVIKKTNIFNIMNILKIIEPEKEENKN